MYFCDLRLLHHLFSLCLSYMPSSWSFGAHHQLVQRIRSEFRPTGSQSWSSWSPTLQLTCPSITWNSGYLWSSNCTIWLGAPVTTAGHRTSSFNWHSILTRTSGNESGQRLTNYIVSLHKRFCLYHRTWCHLTTLLSNPSSASLSKVVSHFLAGGCCSDFDCTEKIGLLLTIPNHDIFSTIIF